RQHEAAGCVKHLPTHMAMTSSRCPFGERLGHDADGARHVLIVGRIDRSHRSTLAQSHTKVAQRRKWVNGKLPPVPGGIAMPPDTLSARTIVYVNIAHAFDHFILLIYPTAVIVIAAQQGLDYGSLINLATGAFVAFGLFSLPMGWIADHVGRRNMLAVFFLGYGASCAGMALAETPTALAGGLLVVGIFSAIYHPIGSAMLVSHA